MSRPNNGETITLVCVVEADGVVEWLLYMYSTRARVYTKRLILNDDLKYFLNNIF